ncbi:MAG: hypothetical protein ABI042_04390 [Verrucomicrobiota bacterium]
MTHSRRRSGIIFCSLIMALTAIIPARADELWTNSLSGFWRDTNNWFGGIVPTFGSTVQITNAGTKTVSMDSATQAANLSVHRIFLNAHIGSTNTLQLSDISSNSPLTILYTLNLTRGGALALSNSTMVVDGNLGGTLNILAGTAIFENSTVDCSAVTARVGRTNNAPGYLTMKSGQFMADILLVGELSGAQGFLTLSNGQITVSTVLSLGDTANSTGTVNIAGGTLLVTNGFVRVGNLGAGQMTFTGGSANFSSEVHIADNVGSSGTISLLGGQLVVTNDITAIGRFGVGQMIVSNATATLTNVSVGRHVAARGTLTVQSNALVNCFGDLSLGRFVGSTGIVFVVGGMLRMTNDTIWVGREGNGQLTLSNGTAIAKNLLVAANFTNTSSGNMLVAGGTLVLSSNLVVGSTGLSTGIVSIVGGNIFLTNSANSAYLEIPQGSVTLAGGTLTADILRLTNATGQFVFNSGTLESESTSVTSGAPFVVGDGTNSATFRLLGGTHTFQNGLVISSNATVTGCGTIVGSIVNNGTLSLCASTIVSIQRTNGTTIFFTTISGKTYTLQYKNSLSDEGWTSLPDPVIGNGNVMSITDSTPQPPTRFYRIAFN